VRGKQIRGGFASTHLLGETPPDGQVFEETPGNGDAFEHVWEFDLPDVDDCWLVVAANRIDGGHAGNAFQFAFAASPEGPYTDAFAVSGAEPAHVVKLPPALRGKLYVKAESNDHTDGWSGPDKLSVDAMAISYRSNISPFAQGDLVVSFIDLLDNATVPIVLYRPASTVTDLGLYGSSHVGILGGIIRTTNIAGILQIDLLKTDYFHASAYPTYLYYNPCPTPQLVEIDVGPEPCDIYEAVNNRVLQSDVRGTVRVTIPANTAIVVVLAPAGGEFRLEGKRTLINDVVVRFTK
jgi:hypothetical protein